MILNTIEGTCFDILNLESQQFTQFICRKNGQINCLEDFASQVSTRVLQSIYLSFLSLNKLLYVWQRLTFNEFVQIRRIAKRQVRLLDSLQYLVSEMSYLVISIFDGPLDSLRLVHKLNFVFTENECREFAVCGLCRTEVPSTTFSPMKISSKTSTSRSLLFQPRPGKAQPIVTPSVNSKTAHCLSSPRVLRSPNRRSPPSFNDLRSTARDDLPLPFSP